MNHILGGIFLSAVLAAPAMAADMPARLPVKAPVVPVTAAGYNWSGFYIGAHAGWGRGDVDTIGVSATGTDVAGTGVSARVDGLLAGGHLGFNWQASQFVLGGEVAGSWVDIDGSAVCTTVTFNCTADISRLFRAGGRLGFAVNNWLIYGTGGWARARVATGTVLIATGVDSSPFRTNHDGWYYGAGIEYGLTPNMIVGVEAFRVDLDDRIHAGAPFVLGTTRRADADFFVIQGRVSWKLGGLDAITSRY